MDNCILQLITDINYFKNIDIVLFRATWSRKSGLWLPVVSTDWEVITSLDANINFSNGQQNKKGNPVVAPNN